MPLPCPSQSHELAPCLSRRVAAKAQNEGGEKTTVYNTEFGYSRKDVIIIGVSLIAFGYGLYYGLQVRAAAQAALALVPQLPAACPCVVLAYFAPAS